MSQDKEPRLLLAVLRTVNWLLQLPGARFVIALMGFLMMLGILAIASQGAKWWPMFYDLKAYVDLWDWVTGIFS